MDIRRHLHRRLRRRLRPGCWRQPHLIRMTRRATILAKRIGHAVLLSEAGIREVHCLATTLHAPETPANAGRNSARDDAPLCEQNLCSQSHPFQFRHRNRSRLFVDRPRVKRGAASLCAIASANGRTPVGVGRSGSSTSLGVVCVERLNPSASTTTSSGRLAHKLAHWGQTRFAQR